ncbi:hypothetical protein [Streptomyces tritici]|uniref:hypothetical protein n=1 Tax=Streptomyces tritici TaxID=2054410 RepID=UPI003AF0B972
MTRTRTATKRIGAALAAAGAAFALSLGGASVADAKIQQVCVNNGGNEPAGQQDSCNGNGLDQKGKNPAGHFPPGHN